MDFKFKKQLISFAFSSFAALTAIPGLASTNLLVNGDFENQPNWGVNTGGCFYDSNCTALTGSQLPGWTIEPGSAVTIHSAGVYPTISGNYSVNTDGEGYNSNNANFYQNFATSNGQQYNLQYDWKGWYQNTTPHLEVSLTDISTSTVLYDGNFVWNAASLNHEIAAFIGTGDILQLRIQESPQSGFNDNTFIVDNFSVSAVPLPSAVWLFGSALAGFIGFNRRKPMQQAV